MSDTRGERDQQSETSCDATVLDGRGVSLPLPAELEDDVGWLLAQILRGYQQAAEATLRDFPGGLRGFQVLKASTEGCSRNQLEIARRCAIDRTVMVRLVDDLERAGLVARCPDPADRRARFVSPTAAGSAQLAQRAAGVEAALEHPLSALDDEQRVALVTSLRLMVMKMHGACEPAEVGVDRCSATT